MVCIISFEKEQAVLLESTTSEMEPSTITNPRQEANISNKIYHERQSKQLCALHALNNLFQSATAFTKQYLDAICKELAPSARIFNPHRSALGLGCYDVNVIIAALAKKAYDVKWFDKRKYVSHFVPALFLKIYI